jgi:flagellar motor switch protein FliN
MAEDQPPIETSTPDASNKLADMPGEQPAHVVEPEAAVAKDGDAAVDFSAIDQAAIDEILKQASFEDPSQAMISGKSAPDAGASTAQAEGSSPGPVVDEAKLPNFQQVMQEAQVNSIDLLRDVDLNVKIELGRSRMLVEDVLKLGEGSVVELDKLAGDPVDVFINERLVARGEVLVLNDNFCVRINEIVAGVKEEGL